MGNESTTQLIAPSDYEIAYVMGRVIAPYFFDSAQSC